MNSTPTLHQRLHTVSRMSPVTNSGFHPLVEHLIKITSSLFRRSSKSTQGFVCLLFCFSSLIHIVSFFASFVPSMLLHLFLELLFLLVCVFPPLVCMYVSGYFLLYGSSRAHGVPLVELSIPSCVPCSPLQPAFTNT